MKTITILGRQVNIAYNIAVQILFEDIVGKSLSEADLTLTRNSLALYYACISVNNKNTDITIDDLMYNISGDEMATLRVAVTESISEWSHIPSIIDDKKEGDEHSKKD